MKHLNHIEENLKKIWYQYCNSHGSRKVELHDQFYQLYHYYRQLKKNYANLR